MENDSYNDDIFIKIEFYEGYQVKDVIYYIERMPFYLAFKYMWYFEYLVALVKIRYPHNKVKLLCGHQTLPLREEYIADKFKSLLRYKYSQLKKLQLDPGYNDDFFGFDKKAREVKIQRISDEIKSLENGEITFCIHYIKGGRINKIKQYIDIKNK